MNENNPNQNTGNRGTFPGNVPAQPEPKHTGNQNTAPEQNLQQATQQQPQQQAPQQAEQPTQQPAANPTSIMDAKKEPNEDANTYLKLETKNSEGQVSGVLEIDLISFRERGVESRYLHVNSIGAGPDNTQSETVISIDNEQDFLKFKEFISDLNWND